MSRRPFNNGVILVDVGQNFRPVDERCTPMHFRSARPFKNRLELTRAIACALQFNREQLGAIASGTFDGRWAMVVFSLVKPTSRPAMAIERRLAGETEREVLIGGR